METNNLQATETEQNNDLNNQNNQSQNNQQNNSSAQRQTAVKIFVKEILGGEYVTQSGWNPNYLKTIAGNVARVNIMWVIVSKENVDTFNEFFVIDDGTGRITIRSFEKNEALKELNIGDIINIIGRTREYSREIFIAPEIIKKIDNPDWIELRKLELSKRKSEALPEAQNNKKTQEETAEEIIVEDVISTPEEYLLKLIRENDKGEGCSIEEMILMGQKSGKSKNSQDVINTLLQNGDIFEVKPGKVKVL